MIRTRTTLAALVVVAASAPVHATVLISTAATQNISCSGGTCVPTAESAVLNASDLENDLSQFGNVRVMTTGNGVEANNIEVRAAFSSPDSTSLTLEAHKAITINAAVSIGSGTAELEVQSDTLAASDTLSIGRKGHIAFGSLSDIFGINGGIFTLVGSVQGLASAVAANPSGAFALANNYDASADGSYGEAPVQSTLTGTFEGLGNVIGNLTIDDLSESNFNVGLFSQVGTSGAIRDIGLKEVNIAIAHSTYGNPGALAGYNQGLIVNAYATGAVNNNLDDPTGGLVARNDGTISGSYAAVNVAAAGDNTIGGLVGLNRGQIDTSFATGNVSSWGDLGGLVGVSQAGTITDSYATGGVSLIPRNSYVAGGLIGCECGYEGSPSANTSYSTGTVPANRRRSHVSGGSIGVNTGVNKNLYWDTTTSATTTGVGGGASKGVTGLTTQQLQSGLPAGFNPKVWAEKSNINGGLPYLINNPPPR